MIRKMSAGDREPAVRISDIEAARHAAELKHREAKSKGYGDFETGYWNGYEHALADLIKRFGFTVEGC